MPERRGRGALKGASRAEQAPDPDLGGRGAIRSAPVLRALDYRVEGVAQQGASRAQLQVPRISAVLAADYPTLSPWQLPRWRQLA